MGTVITGPNPAFAAQFDRPQESPLSQIGQILALKNQAQLQPLQMQAAQQNVQAGALENQQKQVALKNQQALTEAYKSWDGNNYADLAHKALQAGATGDAVMALQQHALSVKDTASQIAQRDAQTGQNLLDTKIKNNGLVAGKLLSISQLPDDQLVKGVTDTLQELGPQLDPQHAQMGQQLLRGLQSGQIQPAQAKQQLDFFRKSFMSDSQIMEDVKSQAAIQKDTAQAGQANAAAQKDQMEIAAGGTGALADSRFRNIAMNQKLGRPVSAEDQAWASAYKQQKTLNPVTTFNLQNAGLGGQGGANGQPSALAQSVANGQMKWGDVISPRTPMSVKQQFAAEVHKLNPDFDTSTYAIQTKAAEKATSGTWADTRVAYNTALDHSQMLLDAAKALQNGDNRTLNTLKNKFATEFGASGPITYDAIANAYNHEVGSVISKGHVTDSEVSTQHATLPSNANLQTIQSVVSAYQGLMKSKRNRLDEQIKNSAGGKANGVMKGDSDTPTAPPVSSGDPFSQFGGKAH